MSALLEQLNSEMGEVAENARRSLVQVQSGRQGGGAGAVWHPDGLIVTNAHVVRNRSLQVTLPDGSNLPARILAHDPARDLAALSVDASGLPAIELGDSPDPPAGAVGNGPGTSLGRFRGRHRRSGNWRRRRPAGAAPVRPGVDCGQPATPAGTFGRPAGG